jgi:hypothetical protein
VRQPQRLVQVAHATCGRRFDVRAQHGHAVRPAQQLGDVQFFLIAQGVDRPQAAQRPRGCHAQHGVVQAVRSW